MTMTFDVKGNLAADPKFEEFGTKGETMVRLRIASDRFVSGGETVPEFYSVTLFSKTAVEALRAAQKGDPVTISGDVRPQFYEKDGVEVHSFNLIGKTAVWQSKEDAKAARANGKNTDSTQQRTADNDLVAAQGR